MKDLLLILLLFSVLVTFSQSKYDFETGVDSIVLKHNIRQTTIYHVGENSDTSEVETYTYSETGLLMKYEMNRIVPKGNLHELSFIGPQSRSCELDYNNEGCLINEIYTQIGDDPFNYTFNIRDGEYSSNDTYENGVFRKSVYTSITPVVVCTSKFMFTNFIKPTND